MSAAQKTARPFKRWITDVAFVVVLLMVSIIGFWPTYAGPAYLVPALGALVLGLAIAFFTTIRQFGSLVVAGLTVAVYFIFGGALAMSHTAIAGVIPTLDTLQKLAVGVVTAWKSLLTTVAPVSVDDGHGLVPFLLTLVATVLTASLAFRAKRPEWALIPAAVFLGLVIVLGTPVPAAPLVQGIIFAIASVSWLALRHISTGATAAVSIDAGDPTRSKRMRLRRVVAGSLVLAVAGGVGIAASGAASPFQPRHVFRDVIIPPFNIHDYPSPLQSFRKTVRDYTEDTLFTVQGLPDGARVRIAAMDEFDGQVYNVTDGGPGTASAFASIRSSMSVDATGTPATLTVSLDAYSSVWMPTVGQVTEIRFAGEDAETLRRSAYYNEASDTAVSTIPLGSGDGYTFDTVVPVQPDDVQLADAEFGRVVMGKAENLPDDLIQLAGETVKDAETPIDQARALETFLSEDGFFSHGLEGDVMSRAGHTAERILTMIGGQQMIGDDEQYAVAMALMARSLDMPARVVFGFYPEEDEPSFESFEANSENVHAWVEINFADIGWVTFDPTPPEDQIPSEQTTKPRANPKPQVLQPPPPPQEPVDLPPTLPDDRKSDDEQQNIAGIIGLILAIGGGAIGLIMLILSPFIIIGAWKAARRRKRRVAADAADRISGGWDELKDRALDYGARIRGGMTRPEEARHLVSVLPVPTATAIAERADSKVFGPHEPTKEDIDAFWDEVDAAVGNLKNESGKFRRLRARLSLRSLLAESKMTRGWQSLRTAALARTGKPSESSKDSNSVTRESETP